MVGPKNPLRRTLGHTLCIRVEGCDRDDEQN
jgi:hypothetical protein